MNWPLATLWHEDEFSQSAPAYEHAFLDSEQSVNKARDCVLLENIGKALWGCAAGAVGWNSRGGVYFACLCGRG